MGHTARCIVPAAGLRTVSLPRRGGAQSVIASGVQVSSGLPGARVNAYVWSGAAAGTLEFVTSGERVLIVNLEPGISRVFLDDPWDDVLVTSTATSEAWLEEVTTLAPDGSNVE